jgi:hypothetical protein
MITLPFYGDGRPYKCLSAIWRFQSGAILSPFSGPTAIFPSGRHYGDLLDERAEGVLSAEF